ncbi:GLUG motif-containing protein [Planctomycetota bacterium]
MAESGDSPVLRTIPLLVACCVFISGCLEFKSIEQPSSILPGEIFTVFVEATFNEQEDYQDSGYIPIPYFGICLPDGWIILDDIIPYTGDYDGTIIYDSNLALEQENFSPAPDGYYWWVGDGNYVDPGNGTVYGEIQIKTNNQVGIFSLDYRLGDNHLGLNYQKSDNHLIEVVSEYTPRELRAQVSKDSIILTWKNPAKTENLVEYNIYRDGKWISTCQAENTEYIDSNLPGGMFFYSVSAISNSGQEYLTPYEIKGIMFPGGVGEPNNPYKIATSEQLVYITDFPYLQDKNFVLAVDINLDPNLYGGQVFDRVVIPAFSGTFDGNDHVISNLTIKGTGEPWLSGMFGELKSGARVKNLAVVDVNITGSGNYIGGLVGKNYGDLASCYLTGTVVGIGIDNCVGGLVGLNNGNITASHSNCVTSTPYSLYTLYDEYEPVPGGVGGLVGSNGGSIHSSYSTSIVSGSGYVGGLVGKNDGSIIQCYSEDTTTGYCIVGGLVGTNNYTGSIIESYSTATVLGDGQDVGGLVGSNGGSIHNSYSTSIVSGSGYLGGFVGSNGGNITASYSTGTVSGDDYLGGLVGRNGGSINNCYSTGTVSGNCYIGGLMGLNIGKVTISYSTGKVSGNDYVGGLVGKDDGIIKHGIWDIETSGLLVGPGGVGLITIEMMDTYMLGLNGFANDPNWILDVGLDYPHLAWEGTPGQIIPEPDIDWLKGSGTPGNPYQINTAVQLISLGQASILCNSHLVLGANIDLDPNLPGGQAFNQAVIPAFFGVFDGNDFTVANLTIRGQGCLGLFGRLASEAQVKNLGLVDVNITGSDYVGSLVGYNYYGTIDQCYSTGVVTGEDYVGGLVGRNSGRVTTSYNTCTVTGDGYVGGLVGHNNGIISTSYSTGIVGGGAWWGYGGFGGLVGFNNGSVASSYSTGMVDGDWRIGGLVGNNDNGSIATSYSTGMITGGSSVGGLVGYSSKGNIISSYSTGIVRGTGNYIGGLIGREGYRTVTTSCFWNIQSSGQTTSADGTGKKTAEMQTATTFLEAGWDFVDETANGTEDIWWILEGQDYPRLWWEAFE